MKKTTGILNTILSQKQKEIIHAKERISFGELDRNLNSLPPCQDFSNALRNDQHITIIAEMKKASPSAGLLRSNFNPQKLAETYAQNGAAALSILTDEKFFQGNTAYLNLARQVCDLPLLRKDFIIDPYQIIEARSVSADAILLIMAALEPSELGELLAATKEYQMQALVEVHNIQELETALYQDVEIIGINNRDLETFEISLQTTEQLAPLIPSEYIIVSESGIRERMDIEQLAESGINAVLVGSHFMKAEDPGAALQPLIGVSRTT